MQARVGWRQRFRAWARREEEGTFQLVEVPLWADLLISAAIVAVALGGAVGFFAWLAATQGRA